MDVLHGHMETVDGRVSLTHGNCGWTCFMDTWKLWIDVFHGHRETVDRRARKIAVQFTT